MRVFCFLLYFAHFGVEMGVAATRATNCLGYQTPTKKLAHCLDLMLLWFNYDNLGILLSKCPGITPPPFNNFFRFYPVWNCLEISKGVQ